MKMTAYLLAIVTLFATFVTAQAASIPTNGLVSWWQAESNALDAIGGHHGALTSGGSFTPGKFGSAFAFEHDGDAMQVPYSPELVPGAGSFTVAAWVKTTNDGGLFYSFYECGGLLCGGASLVEITAGDLLILHLRDTDGGGPIAGKDVIYGNQKVNDGLWHHLLAVRDVSAGRVILYVDGVQDTNVVLGIGGNGVIAAERDSDPIFVGAGTAPSSEALGGFLHGSLDELMVYRRALSAEEVSTIYLELGGRSPETRLTIRLSQVELCWNTLTNKTYQLQFRSDLTTNMWSDLGPMIQGDGTTNCVTDPIVPGQSQRFYQVLTTP